MLTSGELAEGVWDALHFSLQHKKLKYTHLNSEGFAYCRGVGEPSVSCPGASLTRHGPGIQEGAELGR